MKLLNSVGVTIRVIGLIFYLVFKIFELIVHILESALHCCDKGLWFWIAKFIARVRISIFIFVV